VSSAQGETGWWRRGGWRGQGDNRLLRSRWESTITLSTLSAAEQDLFSSPGSLESDYFFNVLIDQVSPREFQVKTISYVAVSLVVLYMRECRKISDVC